MAARTAGVADARRRLVISAGREQPIAKRRARICWALIFAFCSARDAIAKRASPRLASPRLGPNIYEPSLGRTRLWFSLEKSASERKESSLLGWKPQELNGLEDCARQHSGCLRAPGDLGKQIWASQSSETSGNSLKRGLSFWLVKSWLENVTARAPAKAFESSLANLAYSAAKEEEEEEAFLLLLLPILSALAPPPPLLRLQCVATCN